MTRAAQLALLGFGTGRGRLLQTPLLEQYVKDHSIEQIRGVDESVATLKGWLAALNHSSAAETSLELEFLTRIFGHVLGYTAFPHPSGEHANLYVKPGSAVSGIGRTPDAVLGSFSSQSSRIDAVLELKSPGTNLDRPQNRRAGETPVEQAFDYGLSILGARWVLVSDMRVIRLYSVESDFEYEEFDLRRCLDPQDRPTASFKRFHYLLHYEQLIRSGEESAVSRLLAKSSARQMLIRDGFYEVYSRIRSDLFQELEGACGCSGINADRETLLEATQRLLDRLLFIHYCEDHPEQLVPDGTVHSVVQAAASLPGGSGYRIYDSLKELFREVDVGSPPQSGLRVPGYNGELFKAHPIVDQVRLPDSLAQRRYRFVVDKHERVVQGIWGLHVFDFWSELNEHLLGHVFEESLSDFYDLGPAVAKLEERKSKGIFYTSSILSDFLAGSALRALLRERAPSLASDHDDVGALEQRRGVLESLRVIDFACGSGAFLVSVYGEMIRESWRIRRAHQQSRHEEGSPHLDLFEQATAINQAAILRGCLFGIDLLPQAAELAKLSLWLRSARRGQKVADLSTNIIAGNSLKTDTFADLPVGIGELDLVIGNPPWGADIEDSVYESIVAEFSLDPSVEWDSWELFTVMGLRALRDGGRLAFVLPDSLFYPEKKRIREILFEEGSVEKVLSLGPDWFGPSVRMGTVLVQIRRGQPCHNMMMQCTMLAGRLRRKAIRGEVPLSQVEAQRSREVPQQRSHDSEDYSIEVFRGWRDDKVIDQLMAQSLELATVCERGRGEEINKAGVLWVCPNCLNPTTPGAKAKGGGYRDKDCPDCGLKLTEASVQQESLLVDSEFRGPTVAYLDGDDISGRYTPLQPSKRMRLDLSGWTYKPTDLFSGPKIVIRQAGIGLTAGFDGTDARCPQSVYLYRLRPQLVEEGWSHEFILGALLSRVTAYYVFKRFGEVDPAKAHAKLTHTRLAELPIPKLDMKKTEHVSAHDTIVAGVRKLLAGGSPLGGGDDRMIETALRSLWGISPEDGAYINGEFFDVPDSQVVRDLFPKGPPSVHVAGAA